MKGQNGNVALAYEAATAEVKPDVCCVLLQHYPEAIQPTTATEARHLAEELNGSYGWSVTAADVMKGVNEAMALTDTGYLK